MEPMTGIDGSFLHMETDAVPMHTVKVLTFAAPAPSLDELQQGVEVALARLPILRQVVLAAPLGFAQPVLVEDAAFELRNHVDVVDLPASGSQRDLDAVVARVAERTLRRDRPLWEVVIVRGLDRGRWAAIVKLHHTLADGGASVAMLSRALSGPEQAPRVAQKPDLASRVGFEVASLWRDAASVPALVRRSIRKLGANQHLHDGHHHRSSSPFEGPKLGFNGPIQPTRRFASTSLPLARLDTIRKERGVTLNDLWLTVMAGALRAYLLARNELPDRPLVASVPVSLSHDEHLTGNDLTSVFAALPVHLPDPLARLDVAHDAMTAAKEELALDPSLGKDWTNNVPPLALRAVLGIGNLVSAAIDRPPVNLVVSTVRGPKEQLQVGGRALEAIHSVGPLVEHVGLNITAWTYDGQLFVGALADGSVTDLDVLLELVPVAVEELALAPSRNKKHTKFGDSHEHRANQQ